MSTFEQSRGQFVQTHFTVIEFDLPVVEGECTISGEPGFGTPLSCDQPSNAVKTYKLTEMDAPILPESGILRVVDKVSETTAKLNTGKGLASRGTASISFIDITGKDPNPDAPAVTGEVVNSGTFFSKLKARNQLTNRNIRIKNYRVESDGSIDLENGAETRHYIIKSVSQDKKGKWKFTCEDELSRINIDETVWPIPLEGQLRISMNPTTTTVQVDDKVDYKVDDTIRIGDEFMKVQSVFNIGTPSASLTVGTRGSDIVYTNTLTKTATDSHNEFDEVYVCEVSDDERIDDLLERILIDVGVPQSMIPKSDWAAEINEWHPNTKINTLWYESIDTFEVLEMILTYFLLDMWFDPVDREVKLSAISVWKQSTATLSENNEINFESIIKKDNEKLRVTRAFVIYDKRFLATSDSIENYKKASLFARTELETNDFYSEPKTKRFKPTFLLDEDSADLLVNRWVNRYIAPATYNWMTPERKLNFNVGDVVDLSTSVDVGFDGVTGTTSRAQITSINPKYTREGREYSVSADSYEPVFDTNSEIVITGSVSDVNLYIQYAGAPSQPVELTFVFDGATSSSSTPSVASIRAGGFPSGSKLIIILANGADLQAVGGNGGAGADMTYFQGSGWIQTSSPGNGADGGIVFDAEGVDCDIYLSGATPSSSYPVADGKILAPSGGAGGFDATITTDNESQAGNGGAGGNGRTPGNGGFGGGAFDAPFGEGGIVGSFGSDTGPVNTFGLQGANNNAVGGTAGSGVIDSGGAVALFGATVSNYVNGNGDHV